MEERGSWRAPKVNESCCVRPQLAAMLKDVAKNGPAALYEGTRAQARLSELLLYSHLVYADLAPISCLLQCRNNLPGTTIWIAQ